MMPAVAPAQLLPGDLAVEALGGGSSTVAAVLGTSLHNMFEALMETTGNGGMPHGFNLGTAHADVLAPVAAMGSQAVKAYIFGTGAAHPAVVGPMGAVMASAATSLLKGTEASPLAAGIIADPSLGVCRAGNILLIDGRSPLAGATTREEVRALLEPLAQSASARARKHAVNGLVATVMDATATGYQTTTDAMLRIRGGDVNAVSWATVTADMAATIAEHANWRATAGAFVQRLLAVTVAFGFALWEPRTLGELHLAPPAVQELYDEIGRQTVNCGGHFICGVPQTPQSQDAAARLLAAVARDMQRRFNSTTGGSHLGHTPVDLTGDTTRGHGHGTGSAGRSGAATGRTGTTALEAAREQQAPFGACRAYFSSGECFIGGADGTCRYTHERLAPGVTATGLGVHGATPSGHSNHALAPGRTAAAASAAPPAAATTPAAGAGVAQGAAR